jgi:hypothetical protein
VDGTQQGQGRVLLVVARITLEHARPEAARKPHDWGM